MVLSLWRRDTNRLDSYRFSTVNVSELPAVQEVHDSGGVTPCIIMKNDGVLYHEVSSSSHESMRLRSLRQNESTTARDPVQHKR